MKFLQTNRSDFRILGISPEHSIHSMQFNIKIFACSFLSVLHLVSLFIYIFYVADTLKEYIECVTVTSGNIIIYVCYWTLVFKMKNLFEAFDGMDAIIARSE